MRLFMPSREVLESIAFDDESHKQYTTFPINTPEFGLNSYLESVNLQLKQFYLLTYQREIGDRSKEILLTVWESMSNCRVHGCKAGGSFTHGLFLGRVGLCNGFYDGGEYFGRRDIKKQWESKTPITKFDLSKKSPRAGTRITIFPASDKIEVDNKERVLYTVHFLQ